MNEAYLIIDRLKGTNSQKVLSDTGSILLDGENVVSAFENAHSKAIFTNMRIILITLQGVAGVKKTFTYIPYKNVQAFTTETSGAVQRDSAIDIFVNTLGMISLIFSSGVDINRIAQIISYYCV